MQNVRLDVLVTTKPFLALSKLPTTSLAILNSTAFKPQTAAAKIIIFKRKYEMLLAATPQGSTSFSTELQLKLTKTMKNQPAIINSLFYNSIIILFRQLRIWLVHC